MVLPEGRYLVFEELGLGRVAVSLAEFHLLDGMLSKSFGKVVVMLDVAQRLPFIVFQGERTIAGHVRVDEMDKRVLTAALSSTGE